MSDQVPVALAAWRAAERDLDATDPADPRHADAERALAEAEERYAVAEHAAAVEHGEPETPRD